MTDKNINHWQDTITPREKAPQPWTVKSGGSWDMLDVQPIPDEMLAELARDYHRLGTPWNCRSLPLSPNDREYMFLLYYSMQGLVARMRASEKRTAELEQVARATSEQSEQTPEPFGYVYRIISESRPHDPMYRFAKTGGLNPDPEVVRSWTKHAVYTEPQALNSRDSVIEECAKVCDAMAEKCEDQQQFALGLCSDAIRALKSQPSGNPL